MVKPFSRKLLGIDDNPAPTVPHARSTTATPDPNMNRIPPPSPFARPKTSMELPMQPRSRGASRLSVRSQNSRMMQQSISARPGDNLVPQRGLTPLPASSLPPEYLIRPNTGKTAQIVRRTGKSQSSRRSRAMTAGDGAMHSGPDIMTIPEVPRSSLSTRSLGGGLFPASHRSMTPVH